MKSYTLRISEEILEKIGKIAIKEERSINSEITYILKKYIEENENNEEK